MNAINSPPDLIPSSEALLFWLFVIVTGYIVAQLSTKISEWLSQHDQDEELEELEELDEIEK
jgi:hypothetical protein